MSAIEKAHSLCGLIRLASSLGIEVMRVLDGVCSLSFMEFFFTISYIFQPSWTPEKTSHIQIGKLLSLSL
jgi:hypothetical protein